MGNDTDRKNQILSVAARLFAEQGYRATSLQDVADVFGMTRPAVYYYFPSKEELLYSIMSSAHDTTDATAERVFAATADPEERLSGLIRAEVLDAITRDVDGSIAMVQMEETRELETEHRREIRRRRRAYFDRHRALLDELKTAGKLSDVDTTVATFGMLSIVSLVSRWYRPDGRLTAEQIADEVTKIALGSALSS
jgi:AcrR family transcriptional regulator